MQTGDNRKLHQCFEAPSDFFAWRMMAPGDYCSFCGYTEPGKWWDYQEVGRVWPLRLGIDTQHRAFHRIRSYQVDRLKDQYPAIRIERGMEQEIEAERWWHEPVWENWAVETIIVRPIVRWYGRG